MAGVKFDGEKNQLDLIPVEFIEATGRALTYGARKYSPNNWRYGMDWNRVYGALQRHLQAFWKGEDLDNGENGSGLHHLDCAAAELAFLITYVQTQTGIDTRWKPKNENQAQASKSSRKKKTAILTVPSLSSPQELAFLKSLNLDGTLPPALQKTRKAK